MSLNKVTLIGNVGKDPDIRFLPDGSRVVSFSLATGESWKDKTTGERKDKTEWHKVVAYNDRLAEFCEKYVKKGSKLYVEGQMQSRRWADAQGVEKHTTEVVISKFRGEIMLMDPKKGEYEGSNGSDAMPFDERPSDIPLDDDIPF